MLIMSSENSIVQFQIKDSIDKAINSCQFERKHPLITEGKIVFYDEPFPPSVQSARIVLISSRNFLTLHEIQNEILKFRDLPILPLGIFAFLNFLRARSRLPLCFKLVCAGDYCHPENNNGPFAFSADANIERERVLWLDDALVPLPPFSWVPCLVRI